MDTQKHLHTFLLRKSNSFLNFFHQTTTYQKYIISYYK